MSIRFNITPTADGIPFDNDTNGFMADNVQDAIEEAVTGIEGDLLDFLFTSSGNTADKWLGVGNGSTSSNTLPFVLPHDSELVWLTFSNQDDNVDIDIEFYKNGTLVYTWNIRNKRTAWKTDISGISCTQGDRVSCFARKYTGGTGDSTAQDPVIEVGFKVIGTSDGEGGTQNGT